MRALFVSATNRACASIPMAGARASTTPSSATLSKPHCCACRSRKPAITALLKGHAIKTGLPSTSVTVIRGSMRLMKRAQVVPANPPPTTTTRPAEPCDMAGIGSAAEATAAAVVSKSRRLMGFFMSLQSFWEAYQFAIALISGFVKPLAILAPVERPVDLQNRRMRRPAGRRSLCSNEGDAVVLQRERADAVARCRKQRIEHSRRGDTDCRFADPAPEATRWHDDGFHFRHLTEPHRVVGVEVGLLDGTILDSALAVEQGREPIHERTGDLPLDLRGVYG